MEKPQFWLLKNKKGKPFSLKTCTQEIKIPEKTMEKVFISFFEVFKDYQSRKSKKLNLYLGVKPNKKNEAEIKFFVSPHNEVFYRSKNSPWRFFNIPSSNRIKEVKVEFFQDEPKVLFRFEV
ncbi:hypothetical protein J7K91_02225 [bacterium]|nr:hypothetical protein [bacterium]